MKINKKEKMKKNINKKNDELYKELLKKDTAKNPSKTFFRLIKFLRYEKKLFIVGGLSPLVVFLSLILWGWLFGAAGMFLSIPLTMIAKIALEQSASTQWVAVMLGNGVAESLAEELLIKEPQVKEPQSALVKVVLEKK